MSRSKLLLRRLAAMFYDSVLVFGVCASGFTLVYVPLALYLDNTNIGQHFLFQFYIVFLAIGFHIWFWTHGGQTLGMRSWKLKVLREDGQQLDVKDALKRYIFAVISLIAAGLGFFWILIDPHGRAWHDIWSRTRVVVTSNPRK